MEATRATYRLVGNPYPWRTPRRTRTGRAYPHPRMAAWQEAVRAQLALQGPSEPACCRLSIRARFALPRPKSHYTATGALRRGAPKWPTKKAGDLTNLLKALEDAATGILWLDDSQVQEHWAASKRYCEPGEEPGVVLEVEELEESDE